MNAALNLNGRIPEAAVEDLFKYRETGQAFVETLRATSLRRNIKFL